MSSRLKQPVSRAVVPGILALGLSLAGCQSKEGPESAPALQDTIVGQEHHQNTPDDYLSEDLRRQMDERQQNARNIYPELEVRSDKSLHVVFGPGQERQLGILSERANEDLRAAYDASETAAADDGGYMYTYGIGFRAIDQEIAGADCYPLQKNLMFTRQQGEKLPEEICAAIWNTILHSGQVHPDTDFNPNPPTAV